MGVCSTLLLLIISLPLPTCPTERGRQGTDVPSLMGWWTGYKIRPSVHLPAAWRSESRTQRLSAVCSWAHVHHSRATVAIWRRCCCLNLPIFPQDQSPAGRPRRQNVPVSPKPSSLLIWLWPHPNSSAHWEPHIVILLASNPHNNPPRWMLLWPFHRWERQGSEGELTELTVSTKAWLALLRPAQVAHQHTVCWVLTPSFIPWSVSVSPHGSILLQTHRFLGSRRTLTSHIRLFMLPQSKTLRDLQSR